MQGLRLRSPSRKDATGLLPPLRRCSRMKHKRARLLSGNGLRKQRASQAKPLHLRVLPRFSNRLSACPIVILLGAFRVERSRRDRRRLPRNAAALVRLLASLGTAKPPCRLQSISHWEMILCAVRAVFIMSFFSPLAIFIQVFRLD
jgi:hypothetical protein